MSFRDLTPPSPHTSRTTASPATPRRIVVVPEPATSNGPPSRRRPRNTRRIVLHGKVQHVECDSDDDDNGILAQSERSTTPIRQRLQQKSAFSQLSHETQQFQQLVSDLQTVLRDSATGDDPQATWRAQILMRSAQEADRALGGHLHCYETTLNGTSASARTAQTACLKLHRDFKRSHKALVMALSTYERTQRAEVSQLGAVGWSRRGEEDFFDQAMRQNELEKMNQSMHQVNDMIQTVAGLVNDQQEQVDDLQDNVRHAKGNVEGAMEHDLNCAGIQDSFCGALDFDFAKSQWEDPFPEFDRSVVISKTPSVDTKASPTSVLPTTVNWYTPFETLPQDLEAVKKDIVQLGEQVVGTGKRFDCNQ